MGKSRFTKSSGFKLKGSPLWDVDEEKKVEQPKLKPETDVELNPSEGATTVTAAATNAAKANAPTASQKGIETIGKGLAAGYTQLGRGLGEGIRDAKESIEGFFKTMYGGGGMGA